MGFLLVFLGAILVAGIEFLVTAGVIYLICLCFGLAFSWKIAIGIWLVIAIVSWIFGGRSDE